MKGVQIIAALPKRTPVPNPAKTEAAGAKTGAAGAKTGAAGARAGAAGAKFDNPVKKKEPPSQKTGPQEMSCSFKNDALGISSGVENGGRILKLAIGNLRT